MPDQIKTPHFQGKLLSEGKRHAVQGIYRVNAEQVFRKLVPQKIEEQAFAKIKEALIDEFDLTKDVANKSANYITEHLQMSLDKPTGKTPLAWISPKENQLVIELTSDVQDGTVVLPSVADAVAQSNTDLILNLIFNGKQKSWGLKNTDTKNFANTEKLQEITNKINQDEVWPAILRTTDQ